MKFTAKQIDDACRQGLFCFVGNREGISGAVTVYNNQPADKGNAWVSMKSDRSWRQVPLTSISIDHPKGETMPSGKGRPGAITHIIKKDGTKKRVEQDAAEQQLEPELNEVDAEILEKARERLKEGGVKLKSVESDGQMIMPGQEKKVHSAIEDQALRLNKAELNAGRARRKVNEERDILTKMMLEADVPTQDLPHGLVAEIDREPKAIVHKKKQPKNIRIQPSEDLENDNETEQDEE